MVSPCIQTYTGRKFWPLDPRPEDVCIEDIAHALSLKCRFGGHCKRFYSVAQHSVLVCNTLNANGGRSSPTLLMQGLMHDAAEAYLPDFPSPIKGAFSVPMNPAVIFSVGNLESLVLNAIIKALDLPKLPWNDKVKRADLAVLHRERLDLMHDGFEWEGLTEPPSNILITNVSQKEAEDWFLDKYYRIKVWIES